jgi:hypothetical protein
LVTTIIIVIMIIYGEYYIDNIIIVRIRITILNTILSFMDSMKEELINTIIKTLMTKFTYFGGYYSHGMQWVFSCPAVVKNAEDFSSDVHRLNQGLEQTLYRQGRKLHGLLAACLARQIPRGSEGFPKGFQVTQPGGPTKARCEMLHEKTTKRRCANAV